MRRRGSGAASWAGRLRSDRVIWVRTPAGHSAEMPTFVPWSSLRNVSVSPSTPYFDVEYMALRALGTMPFIDDVLTMWPSCPLASMAGRKASMPWTVPHRLTPSIHTQSS